MYHPDDTRLFIYGQHERMCERTGTDVNNEFFLSAHISHSTHASHEFISYTYTQKN